MSKVSGTPFGVTKKGEEVRELTLDNGTISCKIITFGATVRTLTVPGRDGAVDVVLGYDTLAEYEENGGYFGAVVGRYANRIAGGRFVLNGKSILWPGTTAPTTSTAEMWGTPTGSGRWRRPARTGRSSRWTAPTGRRATPATSRPG